jgi:hypothetical protein
LGSCPSCGDGAAAVVGAAPDVAVVDGAGPAVMVMPVDIAAGADVWIADGTGCNDVPMVVGAGPAVMVTPVDMATGADGFVTMRPERPVLTPSAPIATIELPPRTAASRTHRGR